MNKHHALNYIEFPADDLAAIKKFYNPISFRVNILTEKS